MSEYTNGITDAERTPNSEERRELIHVGAQALAKADPDRTETTWGQASAVVDAVLGQWLESHDNQVRQVERGRCQRVVNDLIQGPPLDEYDRAIADASTAIIGRKS